MPTWGKLHGMAPPRRRLGCLTGGLIVLLLLVAIAVVADRLLLAAAEDEAERRIDAAIDADDVRVEVRSLPFLPRLVADGQVERIDVEVDDLTQSGVTFAEIAVRLEGLEIDRDEARARRIVVESIERGTARVVLGQGELSDLVGVTVSLGDGTVTVGGITVTAPAFSVSGAELFIGLEGVGGVTIPLPTADLVPCSLDVAVVPGALELTCTLDEVPTLLTRVALEG